MNEQRIARCLVRLAKRLSGADRRAALGFEVTMRGGDRGGVLYFRDGVSFDAESASNLDAMMDRRAARVKKVLDGAPHGKFRYDEPKLRSGDPCVVLVDVRGSWKGEDQARAIAGYLEGNVDVGKFEDWLDV